MNSCSRPFPVGSKSTRTRAGVQSGARLVQRSQSEDREAAGTESLHLPRTEQ